MQSDSRKETRQWKGILMLVLFAFFVAWQTPFARILQNHGVPQIGTVTMLFVLAAVLINAADLVTGQAARIYRDGVRHLKVLVPAAVLNFVGSIGLFFSVHTLNVGVAVVLLYLSPVLICIFFLLTKIRPVPHIQRVAAGICIFGCLCAVNVFQTPLAELSVTGILFALLAAASLGGYTLSLDLLVPPELDRQVVVTFVLDIAAVLSILVYPGMFAEFAHLTLPDIGIFLYLAVVTKLLCLYLLLAGTKIVGAARSAVIQSLEIPFSLLVAYLTLHQLLSPVQFIGVGLVFLAVILMQKK